MRDGLAALHRAADGGGTLLAGPGAQLAEPAGGHGGRVDAGGVLVGGQFLWVGYAFFLYFVLFCFFWMGLMIYPLSVQLGDAGFVHSFIQSLLALLDLI